MSAPPAAVEAPRERTRKIPRPAADDLMLYVAFAAICVVFAIIAPQFSSWANLEVIAIEAATVAIVAAGATFVIIAADIDLSVGSMYALAGTLAAYLMDHGWGWGAAVGVVFLAALLVGVLNGALTVKGKIPAFLVTLGMLGVVRGIDQMLTGTAAVPIYNQSFNDFFAGPLLGMNRPIFWGVIVCVIAAVVLGRTVFGRYVYAVGGNAETSRLAGIPVGRVRMTNFILSALLAAFAGLIVAGRIQTGQPTLGVNLELDVITAVILGGTNLFGGRGRIIGTVIGALLITIIGNGLLLLGADDNLQTVCKGGILILAVLARRLADRSATNGG